MDDLVEAVQRSLADRTAREFDRRVAEQAEAMAADCESGLLDSPGFAAGMELEAYVVDEEGRLAAVPEAVFDLEGCDAELGLHNLEIHTPPDALDDAGLARQAETIRSRVERARERLGEEGRWLVLDGMWTVPPAAGTRAYLGATRERDGVVVAENMRTDARYSALDNEVLRHAGGTIPLSVPGFEGAFPSILVESLATSIQPHLQIPESAAFPTYFDLALRTTGPVLALTTNSPFLPLDLYDLAGADDVDAAADLVETTYHELRVPVFEQSINAGLAEADRKVRFPRDVETTTDVVRRLVADETYAPFLADDPGAEAATYRDRYPELAHKRGTYWRWLRAVVGGERVRGAAGDEASIRIEYRPIPTQPTATDVVACQALVCGLVRGLDAADHPLGTLPWEDARESFYAAVRDGLDADLAWVDADGARTSDPETVYDEVFTYARRGLGESGVAAARVDDLLAPLEARWDARTTPSQWKKARVLAELDDGADFEAAVTAMQRDYVERSLAYDSFAEWL
ncbi:MAG: hypothetical protein ABEJ74_02590 [Haloferacaceae archaeon]